MHLHTQIQCFSLLIWWIKVPFQFVFCNYGNIFFSFACNNNSFIFLEFYVFVL